MLARKTTFPQIGRWTFVGSVLLLLAGGVVSCSSSTDTLLPNNMGGVGAISVTSVSPAVAGMTGGTLVAVYGSGISASSEADRLP